MEKKYHTVGTAPKSKEVKCIFITHKYTTAHFHGLMEAIEDGDVRLVLWTQHPPDAY